MKNITTKLFIASAIVFSTLNAASAQGYEQGDKLLNVGVGFGSTFLASGLKSTLPPVGLRFELGVTDKISAGAYMGYAVASHEMAAAGGNWEWKYSYVIIGARGSYHFVLTEKLDTYAGAMLGYNKASVTVTKPEGYAGPELPSAEAGGMIWGGHVGARYMFSEKIGAFGEVGYGIAVLNLGVTAKF